MFRCMESVSPSQLLWGNHHLDRNVHHQHQYMCGWEVGRSSQSSIYHGNPAFPQWNSSCFLYVDVSVILQPLIRLAFFGYHLFCLRSRQEFCNLHNKMSNHQHTLSLIPFTGRTPLFLVELMKGESIDQTRTSVTMTTSWRDAVVWFLHSKTLKWRKPGWDFVHGGPAFVWRWR